VRRLCAIAGVSRCGYYKYLRHDSEKQAEDKEIGELIFIIQEQYHYSIGYRKMIALLEKETGKKYGTKRIRRIMKENDLQSTVRVKKYSDEVYIRRRKMKEALPPDLIKRNFFAMEPYRRLVEDITYLPCLEQTMYLNTIEDLFNGEIHAYAISDSVNTKLCTDTVKVLDKRIKITDGVILHSDGGSTYISFAYIDLLCKLHIQRSMGAKGSCYDNAPIEALNGIIKTECLYCRFGKSKVKNRMIPRKDIISAVTEFIDFYNTFRPKERLGFLSPVEFRLLNPKGVYPVVIHP
jgi:putative transposase